MSNAVKFLRSFTIRVLVAGFALGLLAGVSNASAMLGEIRNPTFACHSMLSVVTAGLAKF
jgi:hypothetical protein